MGMRELRIDGGQPAIHLERDCVLFDETAPVVVPQGDVQLTDGTIEIDLAVTGERSFPGLAWRVGGETFALMTGENIAARLLVFGAGVVRLCRRLPDDAILTASIRTAKQRDVTSCAEARSWRTRDGGEPGSSYLVAPSE